MPNREGPPTGYSVRMGRIEKAFQPVIVKVGRQGPGQPGGGSPVKSVGYGGLADTTTVCDGLPGLST